MVSGDKVKLPVSEIYFEKAIYPRENPNGTVIDNYEEMLVAGKTPPPLIVKKILYVVDGCDVVRNVILDGVHRCHGTIEFNKHSRQNNLEKIEVIEVIYHDDSVDRFDDKTAMAELIVAGTEYNKQHGVQIKRSEKEAKSRLIYTLNKDFSQARLADLYGVAQSTVSGWLKDLILAENASENAVILKLHLLGWTQEEIGNAVGKARTTITERMSEISNLINLTKSLSDGGQTPEKIARDQQIDLQVVLAVIYDEKTDVERMKKLSCDPRPYDVWNFSDCNSLCGSDYPGRIPGQLVLQTLYFYTEQGALVIDPMGGSGTTIDACLLMGRKCRAFDSKPEQKRVDIIIKDAIAGLSEMRQKADLIFLDPPYFKKVDDGYSDASISRLNAEEYMGFFAEFAKVAKASLKRNGKFAFLMSDYIKWTSSDPDSIFVHDYIKIFTDAGFKIERIIQCPLSSQQIRPDTINKFRERKQLAKISRSLVIFGV